MPDQRLVLVCQWEEPGAAPVRSLKLDISPSGLKDEPRAEQRIPGSETSVRPSRYIPQAALEQRVVEADGEQARPGVELSIEGPSQSFRRWLIVDDPERNRLISFIGTWRFMAAKDDTARDELFRQFESELTREPKLIVSGMDGGMVKELDLHVGSAQPLEEPPATIRVLRFLPDYGIESTNNQAVNRSEQRRNPAALVELSSQGKTEERWIFAKFPDFGPKGENRLPIRATLDCPIQGSEKTPDFAIVARSIESNERYGLELWTRQEGKARSRALPLGESVDVPDSQYRFRALSFLAKGRMVEEYQPAASGKGVPALLVETRDGADASKFVWLQLGETKTIPRHGSPLSLSFQLDDKAASGSHP